MEVVAGKFQITSFGPIPNDWDFREIDADINLLTGFPFSSSQYSSHGIRLLRGSNIKRGVTDWSEDITQFWAKITNDIKKYILEEGDIVIAMDGSLVGRSFAKLSKDDLPALLLQRVARVRSLKIDMGYLKEFVCSEYFTKHCDAVKTSSAIPHISPSDIRKFKIPIPPTKAEQFAIATALSDAANYITHLEKLIEKKRLIKQGAMQKLFKPKKDWSLKKLVDVGKTYGGLTGKVKSDFINGTSLYIPFMNVMSNPVIDTSYFDYVRVGNSESQNLVLKGDLLFNGSSETPEEVGMCSVLTRDVPKLYLNSFCFGFRLFDYNEINALYLSYFFRSGEGRQLIFSLAQGATRYNLSKTNFLNLSIPFPKLLEQTEIASILFEIDAEIDTLKTQLSKARSIKQGMMQQLLTGKIRLV